MIANMYVGGIVSIWDSNEDGRVWIGIGQCKDPLLVSIYDVSGMKNYIVLTIVFEQQTLFCPTSIAQYCREMIVFGL